MNVSNKDWIHVNRFIRSASPKGSSQDRISEVDTLAWFEPVLVGYSLACALDRIVLPGACVLCMLENSGRGFHPEVEGDNVINSGVAGKLKRCQTNKMHATAASSNSSYAIFVCMPPDSLLLLLRSCEPEVALVPLVERATAPPSVAESVRSLAIFRI